MSEAMLLPPLQDAGPRRPPTVYFIDDSATMREVIKIAFRRENFNVVTCADAASALAQFEQTPPDVVITDVIMPDQDGYSVCSQIKDNPQFSQTPVILMSGVVNKAVADKAVAVHADELIRKPFQPQELIGRVKSLLNPQPAPAEVPMERLAPAAALSSLFAPAPPPTPAPTAVPGAVLNDVQPDASAWPRALAEAFTPRPPVATTAQTPALPARPASPSADVQRLRAEIARLELLIKKLQTELQIERQYNQALELHIRALNGSEGG
jgi:CheY-like chemotaxis protein